MKLPGGAFMTIELLLKQVFRQIKGVWNKSISEFTVFQVPGVQNNQYTKVCIWGWLFQLRFICKVQYGLTHLSESWCSLSLVTTSPSCLLPFIGLDHCPYTMVLEQQFNREKANTTNPLEAIAAEFTQHNFQHNLLVKGCHKASQ